MARKADRRPGQGGGQQEQGCSTTSVRRAVLAVLAPGEPVTFPELAARLEAAGVEVDGDQTLALAGDPNVVLWSRWRSELIDALVELVAAGRVTLERCAPSRYNGAALALPVAPLRRPPARLVGPCWLPVTVTVPGRYRLAEMPWRLTNLARVRRWSP